MHQSKHKMAFTQHKKGERTVEDKTTKEKQKENTNQPYQSCHQP